MAHSNDPNAGNLDETPDEEIIVGFRQSWHEVMTGDTRPIAELWDETEEDTA